MTSRLAVFDIDGTLTDTNAVDDECFLEAVGAEFAVELTGVDWSDAPHVTDASITRWLVERHCGRAPDDTEIERLVRRFVGTLERELARTPERFAPIAGARDAFALLEADGWDIALATGGWGPSARLKLNASGLDVPDMVLACANDAVSREEIVRLARDRAAAIRGASYDRVVSIGDGVWDVRTAANLELPFIGIATGEREAKLRASGASVVLPDFRDVAAFRHALVAASKPLYRHGGAKP